MLTMSKTTKLSRSMMIPQMSKSSSSFMRKSPSVASWKARKMQKTAEEAKKLNKELQAINEKKKMIQENIIIAKVFTEERRNLLEQISTTQLKINTVVAEIQNIRKNNESLHQESLKLAKKTQDLISGQNLFKKEQVDVLRDIESCEKEIGVAQRMNKVNVDKLLGAKERVVSAQEVVNELSRKIKVVENEKLVHLENNWRINKEIKRVQYELQKLQKLKIKQ